MLLIKGTLNVSNIYEPTLYTSSVGLFEPPLSMTKSSSVYDITNLLSSVYDLGTKPSLISGQLIYPRFENLLISFRKELR